jgi:hypothetical protein
MKRDGENRKTQWAMLKFLREDREYSVSSNFKNGSEYW